MKIGDKVVYNNYSEYINLDNCKQLNNVIFPEKCLYVDLENCEELNNVTFPKEITGYLDLSSLKSLENVTLPKEFNNLYLNLINSSEVVLPKKHGEIFFKNKCVYSNIW